MISREREGLSFRARVLLTGDRICHRQFAPNSAQFGRVFFPITNVAFKVKANSPLCRSSSMI